MNDTRSKLAVIALLILACTFAWGREETLEQLKAKAERAKPEDRPPLEAEIAKRDVANAADLYKQGNSDAARAAVEEAAAYSEKATNGALLHRKHLKRIEIHLREMSHRLTDVKRTVTIEDQTPIQNVIDRMEKMRTQLLEAMFKKEK